MTITWLRSICYEVTIKSNKNLAKVFLCLSYNMRSEFLKVICNKLNVSYYNTSTNLRN